MAGLLAAPPDFGAARAGSPIAQRYRSSRRLRRPPLARRPAFCRRAQSGWETRGRSPAPGRSCSSALRGWRG